MISCATVLATLILSAQQTEGSETRVVLPDGSRAPLYPESCTPPAGLPSPFTAADGKELLTIRLAAGGTALIDVTRVDDDELRQGVRPVFGAGRQLVQGCTDFPTLARTGLHAPAELDEITSITGRSVAEINRIGQPDTISTAGFLATGEDVLDVIRADNEVVAAMGLTHPQLARPLFHVWNLIRAQVSLGRVGSRSAGIAAIRYHDRWLEIETGSSRGWQESLFADEVIGNSQFWLRRDLSQEEESFLRRQYPELSADDWRHMVHHLTRIHSGEMVAFYIQRYGFYEGHTSYRADPVALAFLAGLRTLQELEAALQGKLPSLLTCPQPASH